MSMVVEAAGGIVYRWRGDVAYHGPAEEIPKHLEVCVIHRPKYDDWSWPKGKLTANESLRHAAVREIGEETGLPVALGAYIGMTEYPLDDEGKAGKHHVNPHKPRKSVHYWIARVIDGEASERRRHAFGPIKLDDHEVDGVTWMSPRKARHMLTHVLDREILDEFVSKAKAGALDAKTVLFIRHGKAEGRKTWTGTDADRPLTPRGAAYAYALTREISCFDVERLVTSPWKRCEGTVEAFSWQTGLPMVMADELTEDAFAAKPDEAWRRILDELNRALDTGETTAICMHRPVIGGIFEHMRQLCATKTLTKQLPAKTPYMPTGRALALSIIRGANGPSIIDIQKVSPIVY